MRTVRSRKSKHAPSDAVVSCGVQLIQRTNSSDQLTATLRNKHDSDNNDLNHESAGRHDSDVSLLLATLPTFQGYEPLRFEFFEVLPPRPDPLVEVNPVKQYRENIASNFSMTKNEALNLFANHISTAYLFGKSVAKQIEIVKLEFTNAIHYKLETFAEQRQVGWMFEPYKCGTIDALGGNTLPEVWSISVEPTSQMFQDANEDVRVAGTEIIRNCYRCGATGRVRCTTCGGFGWERCLSCNGDGVKIRAFTGNEVDRCFLCNALGRRKCIKCGGDCKIKCNVCKGSGQVKCFIQLKIKWNNYVDHFVIDASEVPQKKLILGSGHVLFEEMAHRINPIEHFPNACLNQASKRLIEKHDERYGQIERILHQRHQIISIPVASVIYRFRGKLKIFWIYGLEKQIHAPQYPSDCCLCSIV